MRAFGVLSLVSAAAATEGKAPFTDLFEEFKVKFGKKYSSAEEELRKFKIFVENVQLAEKMSSMDEGNAKYGHLSPLADMSQLEFAQRNTLEVTELVLKNHAKKAVKTPKAVTLPSAFDWREKGAVNGVKNQGQCGSCWAFGTVANIESQNFLVNGNLLSLSEQEIVDCSESDNGCNGGLPSRAYEDMIDGNMGLELESAYGYNAVQGSCKKDPVLEKVYLSNFVRISQDEDEIAQALMKYGVLAIGINAGPMQMYMGGIADPWFCSPSGIDHAVNIVGFGSDERDHWIIRNSWGPEWGEEGYYRIVRGKGKCGLNRMVSSSIVKASGSTLYV